MRRRPRILLSAGEASGDRLAAGLARELLARCPGVDLVGMGGDEMADAGVRLVRHASEVAVVGLVEVLTHLPAVLGAMEALEAILDRERPDLVVPVDYPDFNLRLAARARARRVPVVYYVSPQVWAWRRGRLRAIAAMVRRMLVLFPFEEPFYRSAGIPVTFVGHPAASRRPVTDREAVRSALGIRPDDPLVALLPGSRRKEVRRHYPILLDALRILRRRHPRLQAVVPRARTVPGPLLASRASRHPGLRILDGAYPEILEVSDVGVVASGTATLDAAMASLPSVVVYRMQSLSYVLARRLVRVDHIALPNLIAGERIFPELVQDDCSPDRIATEIGRFLDDPRRAEAVRTSLGRIRQSLSGEGAFGRAAEAVLSELPPGLR